MMEKEFPADATNATVALYYRTGIVTGLFAADCAKDWAYSLVEALDSPSVEIVEVATANDSDGAIQALRAIRGDADEQSAGRWLFGYLHGQILSEQIAPLKAARAAMRIAEIIGLAEDIWMDFMIIENDLHLAADGVCGYAQDIEANLLRALRRHASVVT